MPKRITFAAALHDACDYSRHPWIYATEPDEGDHALWVAHCKRDCPEPTDCACEEQTHLDWETLSSLYVQAVGAEAVPRDIETWDAEDADLILQIALWGEQVFG